MGTASFSTFSRPYSRINSSARRTVAGSANMFGLLPARCPPPPPSNNADAGKSCFAVQSGGNFVGLLHRTILIFCGTGRCPAIMPLFYTLREYGLAMKYIILVQLLPCPVLPHSYSAGYAGVAGRLIAPTVARKR